MKIINVTGNTQLSGETFDVLIFVEELVHVNRVGSTVFLFYRGVEQAKVVKFDNEAGARKVVEEILSFVDEVK